MLARCHLLGWWWRHSASQMSSAGTVVRTQCWPDAICWYSGGGTVWARCHLLSDGGAGIVPAIYQLQGWWWGNSAGEMSSAAMVVEAQCWPWQLSSVGMAVGAQCCPDDICCHVH